MRNTLVAAGIVLIAALSRLLPHPPNFTPIAAIALAGGVYMNRRYAMIVPLVALVISDAIIGFHNTIYYVYGSFVLIGLIGLWLKSHKTPLVIFGGVLMSSVLFFLITNFGVWLAGDGLVYPRSLAGLIECYTAGIPFFRNTMLGDVVFTAALFGIFEGVERTLKQSEAKRVTQDT
ncbi:MAG: DUF6580 family putative transport protein [Bacteroidota bacterium]